VPTVTPTYPADDTGADVSDYNLIIQSILAVFNGNIDADNLVTSAITTPKIANSAVTAAKIASDAVTTAKIASDAVTTAKIASDAVTTAKILDANVTNAKLATGADEPGGAWTSWTPSLENLNVGTTGVVRAIYTKIGNTVHFQFKAFLGGTGISVGDIKFSVPVNASSNYTDNTISVGAGFCREDGSTRSTTIGRFENAAEIRLLQITVSGDYLGLAVISSTTPHTWAAGDVISLSGTYESV
jgi:hypothetical protein